MLGVSAAYVDSAPPASPAAFAAATAAGVGSGATVDITKSNLGTVANGDLLLAFCWANNSTSTWSAPGFASAVAAGDSAILWRVADGSEAATITFTRTGTTGVAGVRMVRITGAHATAPIDVAGISSSAAVATLALGTLTTTGSNELLVQFASRGTTTAGVTATPPASATERFDSYTSGTGMPSAGGDEVVNAGATGSKTWTFTSAGPNRGGMVAIKPAA